MSREAFYKALAFTLKWEGGKSNDPTDPGGRTDFGITQATYNTYRKNHKLPLQSVYNISTDEVRTIYQTMFWSPSYAYICDLPLSMTLFDTAVNFNPGTFRKFLAEALAMKQPGLFAVAKALFLGPSCFMTGEMLAALKALSPGEQLGVALNICEQRKAYRYFRVKQNPAQAHDLAGWLRRDNDLEAQIRGIK